MGDIDKQPSKDDAFFSYLFGGSIALVVLILVGAWVMSVMDDTVTTNPPPPPKPAKKIEPCCVYCKDTRPCGDTCIPFGQECLASPGCACHRHIPREMPRR